MILVIGIPLIGILYFFDQYRDPGPSLANRAIQAAEDAVRKNPNSVNARFALAEYYAGERRYQDAIGQYSEILKAEPKSVTVLLARGRAEAAFGKTDAAAGDFESVVTILTGSEMAGSDKNLEAAYYELGVLELGRGQPQKAVDLLTKSLRIDRTDADALYAIGQALVKTGDASSGIAAFRSAIALVPTGWCEPYGALAQSYAAQKDASGAGYASGMLAFCEKRYGEAKAQLTAATSTAYALDAWVGLALLAEAEGDNQGAVDAYKKALAMDPKNFLASVGMSRVNGAVGTSASPSPSVSGGN